MWVEVNAGGYGSAKVVVSGTKKFDRDVFVLCGRAAKTGVTIRLMPMPMPMSPPPSPPSTRRCRTNIYVRSYTACVCLNDSICRSRSPFCFDELTRQYALPPRRLFQSVTDLFKDVGREND